jgi:hypothetical protein
MAEQQIKTDNQLTLRPSYPHRPIPGFLFRIVWLEILEMNCLIFVNVLEVQH